MVKHVNILVTGGAGFIGRHLVRLFLEKGHRVIIFDNFANSARESISDLLYDGAKLIAGDITEPSDIDCALKNQDIVVHLAAKISVSESVKNPLETFRVNVDGTRNLLDACKKNCVKNLIAASSAAVYGEGKTGENSAERSNTVPVSPYGKSKLQMEKLIREHSAEMNHVILRFFNIYGPGQSDEYAGVITKFSENILHSRPLEIFGDGSQTRDFVAITDVINSIYSSVLKINDLSGVYNVASGQTTTIKDLAELMIAKSGAGIGIKYLPARQGDIRYSQADISDTGRDLGSPHVKLETGIRELYFDN